MYNIRECPGTFIKLKHKSLHSLLTSSINIYLFFCFMKFSLSFDTKHLPYNILFNNIGENVIQELYNSCILSILL